MHYILHKSQHKAQLTKGSKQRMASKSIVTLGFGFLFFLSYWCCLVMSHCFVFVLIMGASSNGGNEGKIWSSYMGGKQLLHYEKLSWRSLLLGLFWWRVLVVQSNASLFVRLALIENISCWGNLVNPHHLGSPNCLSHWWRRWITTDPGERETQRKLWKQNLDSVERERERGRESFGDIHCLAFVVE